MKRTIILMAVTCFFSSANAQPPCNVQITADPATMELYSVAVTNTNKYIVDNNLNTTSYSFSFKFDANFQSYINSVNVNYLHFILAENVNNANQLILYMAGINSSYNHLYLQDKTSSQYYVFKSVTSMGQSQLPQAPPVANGVTVPMNKAYSDNNLDAVKDIPTWITAYQKFTNFGIKNTYAYSYDIKTSVLKKYLNAADASNISNLLVYLADNATGANGDKIELIFIAQDANGNAVYINQGNSYWGLEYCNPCPECIGLSATGSNPQQLENPCPNGTGRKIIDYNMKDKGKFEKAFNLK